MTEHVKMVKFEDVMSPMTFNLIMSMGAGVLLGWLLKGKYGRQVALRNEQAAETAASGDNVRKDSGSSGSHV